MGSTGSGLLLAAFLLAQVPERTQDDPRALRGVWISAGDLTGLATRASVAEAVLAAADAGANVLFAPAWVGGATTFRSTTARDALGLAHPDRDLLAEMLFEAHRRGLEVVPWIEAGIPCPDSDAGEACALLSERPESFVRGEDGKPLVLDGIARLDARRSPAAEVVGDLRANYDLDGIVLRGRAGEPSRLFVSQATDPSDLALPEVAATIPEPAGDVLVPLATLLAGGEELSTLLLNGPWAEPADPPWRKNARWRPRADPIPPFAGAGLWNWKSQKNAPDFLVIDGGESGHITWSFEPPETGPYDLYAWVPSRADLAPHLSFRIATAGSSRTVGIDTTHAPNRGWVYLGWASLKSGQKMEIARLEALEPDATLITAAGPIVPLLDRRTKLR